MKKINIMIIIAIILGILCSIITLLSASYLSTSIFGFEELIASLLGIIGLWLLDKDKKIASIQFILVGLGVFFGCSMDSLILAIITAILFIIIAILLYQDYRNIKKAPPSYGTDNEDKDQKEKSNKKYWIIPVITIIILFGIFMIGSFESDNENFLYYNYMNEKSTSVKLNNITNDITTNYGFTAGHLKATLTTSQEFSSGLDAEVIWYAEDGTQLGTGSDNNVYNEYIYKNQPYKIDFYYYESDTQKPTKAQIIIYDQSDNQIVYNQNVTL